METLNNPPEDLQDFLDPQTVSEAIDERKARRQLKKRQAELAVYINQMEEELPVDVKRMERIQESLKMENLQTFEVDLSELKLKDEKAIMSEFEHFITQSLESVSRLNNERIAKKEQAHLEALERTRTCATEIVTVSEHAKKHVGCWLFHFFSYCIILLANTKFTKFNV